MSTGAAGSPRLALEVPREARLGATVPIVLRVENAGDRALELYLRGRTIAFDVVVADAGGRPAWRRLDGEVIPAVLQLRTLAPGEALVLRAAWDQRTAGGAPAPAGEYTVRALLLTDAAPLEAAAAPLRLVAPA